MSDNCNCGCDNHTHHTDEESKYDFVIAEYGKAMTDEEVAVKVKKLIEDRVEDNNTIEVKKQIFNCIDLTTLKCTDSEESVMRFTEKVNELYESGGTRALEILYGKLVNKLQFNIHDIDD